MPRNTDSTAKARQSATHNPDIIAAPGVLHRSTPTNGSEPDNKVTPRGAALYYSNRYGWPTMPVSRTGDKVPCVKWKQYQTDLPDNPTLSRWFQQFPGANVGVITGEMAGAIVVETDSEEAHEWLTQQELPRGPVAQSSKPYKRHFYFKHPGFRVANSASQIHEHIDVRGDGGYVVAPPSIHHTGVEYTWIVTPDEAELPEAPEWLLDLIIQKSKPDRDPDAVPVVPIRPNDPNASRLQKWATAALNGEAQRVATAPDGKKHEQLRNSAISLGTMVPHGLLAIDEIEGNLFAAIADRAQSKSNARATIRDGIKYGCHYPRELPEPAPARTLNGTTRTTTAAAPEYSGQQPTEEPPAPFYETFTFKDLATIPRLLWLIRGLLMEKIASVLSADTGCFKSFIALAMGLCIATGREFFGREVKQGAVVYVAAEGFYTLLDRATAWAQYHECELPEKFHMLKVPVNLADEVTVQLFGAHIEELSPAFVVLDTLSQNAIGANENDNAQMADFVRGMMALGNRIGAHVMVLHHNGKTTGTFRGAGSIKANVDAHISLDRPEGDELNTVFVRCEKQRGRPFEAFALRGEEITLPYIDEYGDPITSLVFDSCNDAVAAKIEKHANAKKADKTKQRLLEAFDLAAIEGAQYGGVKIGFWKDKVEEADPPICEDSTFWRHRRTLEKDGIIEECGTHQGSTLYKRATLTPTTPTTPKSSYDSNAHNTVPGYCHNSHNPLGVGDVTVPEAVTAKEEVESLFVDTPTPAKKKRKAPGANSEPYSTAKGDEY